MDVRKTRKIEKITGKESRPWRKKRRRLPVSWLLPSDSPMESERKTETERPRFGVTYDFLIHAITAPSVPATAECPFPSPP